MPLPHAESRRERRNPNIVLFKILWLNSPYLFDELSLITWSFVHKENDFRDIETMFPVINTKAHFRRIFTFLRFIMSWFIFLKFVFTCFLYFTFPSVIVQKSKIIKQMQRFRLCRSAAEKLSETSRQIHHYFEPDDTFGLWNVVPFLRKKIILLNRNQTCRSNNQNNQNSKQNKEVQ